MPDLRFNIVGDGRSLSRALNKASKDVRGFKSKLGGIGSIAAGVFGGGAALAGLSSLTGQLGSVVTEAREAARVGRLTEAVIKSTGGVANVTASQVSKLAEAISNKTGIDDEQIQSAENLLLTFTNVRNEVGKGNDIFNQATQAATDMSVALGTDSKSAALQLGKALNDPIKGITALSRAGVSFTQQQKDQIKAMVAAGDTLGAQKLILRELGKEFGGAAAAATDPMQKLNTTVANLKERLGTALLPVLNTVASWLADHLPKAIDKVMGWFRELRDGFNWAKAGGEGSGTALQNLGQKVYDLTEKIKDLWHWIEEKLNDAFAGGKKVLQDLADAFQTDTPTIVGALGLIAASLLAVAVAWNAGPGLIVTAIAGLVLGFLWLYQNVDGFRQSVQKSFNTIGAAVRALVWFWTFEFNAIRDGINRFRDFLSSTGEFVSNAFNYWMDGVRRLGDMFSTVFGGLRYVALSAFNGIANMWNNTVGKIGFTVPDWIPAIGGKSFNVPDIPTVAMADGGIVTRPTVALIGEAGPEAVVPLSRAGRPANIGMGGGTINVQVDVKVDPITGRKVYQLVQDDQRRNGAWNIKLSPSAA